MNAARSGLQAVGLALALVVAASCARTSSDDAVVPSAGPLLTENEISAALGGREDICVLIIPATLADPAVTFFLVLEALKSNPRLYETLVGGIAPRPNSLGLTCVAAPAADSAQYAAKALRKSGVPGRVYVRADDGKFAPVELR